jgi:hypothetical protein
MKIKTTFIKYPKIAGFIVIIIFAYLLFKSQIIIDFIRNLNSLNYLGSFIAGMFYSFGFTSPLSAGFFLTLNTNNILITGLIGGVGAMLADLLIFRFVKVSFMEEFNRLKHEKISRKIKRMIFKLLHKKTRMILTYISAGILIASPLPDEAGITLLAGLSKMSEKTLAIIGFILNTLGIISLLILRGS